MCLGEKVVMFVKMEACIYSLECWRILDEARLYNHMKVAHSSHKVPIAQKNM